MEDCNVIKISSRSAAYFLTFTMSLTLALFSQSLFAVECKGMEKLACERQDACTWVNSYKRKDGVQVSGYCRSKGGKKSSSSSSSSSTSSSTTNSSN
ncbi:hypothetical protein [Halochromatium salexigens]|uniref:hypothetical protein n=1 Tax=Halochromatium salexigens TaxID=49447 RepID=UPI0019122EDB|nr:hypothetical protein [Halochromatium salexigens]